VSMDSFSGRCDDAAMARAGALLVCGVVAAIAGCGGAAEPLSESAAQKRIARGDLDPECAGERPIDLLDRFGGPTERGRACVNGREDEWLRADEIALKKIARGDLDPECAGERPIDLLDRFGGPTEHGRACVDDQ
jgi:hypothetical protein